jgi:predicted DNA-binding mobile mystery protein A
MSPDARKMGRQNLDRQLANFSRLASGVARPSRGWIRAIREALGMTSAQFAKRMGVSQPRAVNIERAEAGHTITLDTLERAAQALDCRLVYTFVPRAPLETLVDEQATRAARAQLEQTRHSMALEAQSLESRDDAEMLKRLAEKLLQKSNSKIWEDK